MSIGEEVDAQFRKDHCRVYRGKELCRRRVTVGGDEVSILYYIYREEFVGVSLSYPPSLYDTMVRVYADKFAQPPHREWDDEIQTRMGAKYLNEYAEWDVQYGQFRLQKYGAAVDTGRGHMLSEQLKIMMKRKQQNAASRLGDDL